MTTNNQTEALKVAREALSTITDKIGGTSFATSIAFGACLDAIETIEAALSATAAPVQTINMNELDGLLEFAREALEVVEDWEGQGYQGPWVTMRNQSEMIVDLVAKLKIAQAGGN